MFKIREQPLKCYFSSTFENLAAVCFPQISNYNHEMHTLLAIIRHLMYKPYSPTVTLRSIHGGELVTWKLVTESVNVFLS